MHLRTGNLHIDWKYTFKFIDWKCIFIDWKFMYRDWKYIVIDWKFMYRDWKLIHIQIYRLEMHI